MKGKKELLLFRISYAWIQQQKRRGRQVCREEQNGRFERFLNR